MTARPPHDLARRLSAFERRLTVLEAAALSRSVGGGGGGDGTTDHGALSGLADHDHLQYPLRSILTSKGDLYVFDGVQLTRIGVGSDGQVLKGDSTQTTGLKWADETGGGTGTTDHGALSGLGDDDHAGYALVSGARAFTGTVAGVDPTATAHLATKGYVDASGGGGGDHALSSHTDVDVITDASTGQVLKLNASGLWDNDSDLQGSGTWVKTAHDFWVDPAASDNSGDGKSPASAWRDLEHALLEAPNHSRIYLFPGDHSSGNTQVPDDRHYAIIGPPTWGRRFGVTGQARITNGTTVSQYMHIKASHGDAPHNAFGFRFENILFDASKVSRCAVLLTHMNYVTFDHCQMTTSQDGWFDVAMAEPEIQNVSEFDSSWWSFLNCRTHRCKLVRSRIGETTWNRGHNAWYFQNPRCQGQNADGRRATSPYIDIKARTSGLLLVSGYMEVTDPGVAAILVDNSGNTNKSNNVTAILGGAERIGEGNAGPQNSRLLHLKNCRAFVAFGGGNSSHNGYVAIDSATTGYFAVHPARLVNEAGDAVTPGARS